MEVNHFATYLCSVVVCVMNLTVAEEGLAQAERITEALYKGDVKSLSTLNCSEIQGTLKGATVVEVFAEPDITILQLAMKAKCFHNESELF